MKTIDHTSRGTRIVKNIAILHAVKVSLNHNTPMAMAPAAPAAPVLEIERRFRLLSDEEVLRFQQKLTSPPYQINNPITEKIVEDEYFDDAHYTLTLGDLWLRRRNGVWELKAPLTPSVHEDGHQKYHCNLEFQGLAQVVAELLARDMIGGGDPRAGGTRSPFFAEEGKLLKKALGEKNLGEVEKILVERFPGFCHITTKRTTYRWSAGGDHAGKVPIVVDLDEVSWSRGKLLLVEVEAAAFASAGGEDCGSDEIKRALDAACADLNLCDADAAPSKVFEYLKKERPEHYAAMVQRFGPL